MSLLQGAALKKADLKNKPNRGDKCYSSVIIVVK